VIAKLQILDFRFSDFRFQSEENPEMASSDLNGQPLNLVAQAQVSSSSANPEISI
jgi:hypothetical protein